MEITGYKYSLEAEALKAQLHLRLYYLGEIKEGQVTSEWVNINEGKFEGVTLFYIKGTFTKVLGLAQVFNIDTP